VVNGQNPGEVRAHLGDTDSAGKGRLHIDRRRHESSNSPADVSGGGQVSASGPVQAIAEPVAREALTLEEFDVLRIERRIARSESGIAGDGLSQEKGVPIEVGTPNLDCCQRYTTAVCSASVSSATVTVSPVCGR
jgi:hypothetical protein